MDEPGVAPILEFRSAPQADLTDQLGGQVFVCRVHQGSILFVFHIFFSVKCDFLDDMQHGAI